MGDADPVTHLPMEDINPGYVPRVLKTIPLPVVASSSNRKEGTPTSPHRTPPRKGKGKEKAIEKPTTGGILSFFGGYSLYVLFATHTILNHHCYRSKSYYPTRNKGNWFVASN